MTTSSKTERLLEFGGFHLCNSHLPPLLCFFSNFVNSLPARPALPLNYLKLRYCRREKTTDSTGVK